jgi:hypothetical protein
MPNPKPSGFMLPHTPTIAAYGLFLLAWSLYEIVTEVAIAKLLKLDDVRGSIVTSGIGQER